MRRPDVFRSADKQLMSMWLYSQTPGGLPEPSAGTRGPEDSAASHERIALRSQAIESTSYVVTTHGQRCIDWSLRLVLKR